MLLVNGEDDIRWSLCLQACSVCGTLCIMTNSYFTDISCLYFLYVGSFYNKVSSRGLRAHAVRERDRERWSERTRKEN